MRESPSLVLIHMLEEAGAVVDYHDELNKRGFSISNPQAKSTCGCGSSFSA